MKSKYQVFLTYVIWDWIYFDSLRLSSMHSTGVNINWCFSVVWSHNIIDFKNDRIQFHYTKNTGIYAYRSRSIWIWIWNDSLWLEPCTMYSIHTLWHCLDMMNSMVLTSGEVTGLSQDRVSKQDAVAGKAQEAGCMTSWYHSEWEGTVITEERN